MFALKGKPEMALVILVVASFALTAVYTLIVRGGQPISQEEAIEISRNTPIVLEGLTIAGYRDQNLSTVIPYEAGYWSVAYIKALKEKYPPSHSSLLRSLPDEHGVWRVHWSIWGSGYSITHFIDEWTGEILYDELYYVG